MSSARSTLLAALLGASTLAAVSAAPASAAASPPRASLTGFSCHSTLEPAARTVTVTSVMRPVTGTRGLSVRVTLLGRGSGPGTGTGSFAAIRGPGLGVWVTPADTTLGQRPGDVWRLAKTVYDVPAPERYRFAVEYRWLGAHGRVLATTSRRTGSCSVRELRPDLLVRSVAVHALPNRPDHERYTATIANRGGTATGPFALAFLPSADADPLIRAESSLAPGAARRVSFLGPVCDAGDPPSVLADPGDVVDDDDRTNNALTVTCPSPAGELD